MKVVEGTVEEEVGGNHHIPMVGVLEVHQKEVAEIKVYRTSLWVVLEEVVVMEVNHKDLDPPMAWKVVDQSHQRLACQSVPLGEVLPFFALEAQGDPSNIKPCKMLTIM